MKNIIEVFEVGDIVTLRSGSPKMTITKVSTTHLRVMYYPIKNLFPMGDSYQIHYGPKRIHTVPIHAIKAETPRIIEPLTGNTIDPTQYKEPV